MSFKMLYKNLDHKHKWVKKHSRVLKTNISGMLLDLYEQLRTRGNGSTLWNG